MYNILERLRVASIRSRIYRHMTIVIVYARYNHCTAVGVAVFRVDGERQVRVVRLHAQFGSSSRCIPG